MMSCLLRTYWIIGRGNGGEGTLRQNEQEINTNYAARMQVQYEINAIIPSSNLSSTPPNNVDESNNRGVWTQMKASVISGGAS
ncbi:hypothetical protein [Nostoc sp. FACHB-888]|uniref:hypothetical protein n=1 Tax=Nostoc sp. FACHB-888 TaxID=2692842 RepID=UPI0016860DA3|nr:hypothetical protein [Nostoc sp. FACHB-888]MBD2249016.1 hypothetical protein [Nostoc sp. FACHB-888]